MPKSKVPARLAQSKPRVADLHYPDCSLRELVEQAQAGDLYAQQDLVLAAELATPPSKRGRPARENDLRRELMNELLWHLHAQDSDGEVTRELIAVCEQCMLPGSDIDEAAILRAIYTVEDESMQAQGAEARITWTAARLAIALNLFDDRKGNPSLATVAERFRKALPVDR